VVYVSFELQFRFFKISMHHAWWFALSLLSLVIVVCIFYSKVNTKSRQTGMQQSVDAYTN
jgi:H+/Cl- antiporter ClcA